MGRMDTLKSADVIIADFPGVTGIKGGRQWLFQLWIIIPLLGMSFLEQ